MAEISVDTVPKKVRDLFNKGFSAFERGNLDYAIDMLFSCVELEPRFLRARKYLRAAEIKRFKERKANPLAKGVASLKGMPGRLTTLMGSASSRAGSGAKAVMAAEKLLKDDPLNTKNIKVFAEAASKADLPEAAVQTLEIGREHFPTDISLINWIGKLYSAMGETRKARACFEKLCELCPSDPDALKLLKDSMAVDSMHKDGWEQAVTEGKDGYRTTIKDAGEAELLEQEGKAVKTHKDANILIEDTLKKIEEDPANINYYRALSRLYVQESMFDEAIAALNKALELSPGDPELDSQLSRITIEQFNYRAGEFERAGDHDGAEAVTAERSQFEFDDLQERIVRYPNDLELRYHWGVKLFEYEQTNDAIQQFQLSQRNPKRRISSLYQLAMCFKAKGQYDMAMDQLEQASAELPGMDGEKKDVVYDIGLIAELMGDSEKAVAHFKQIYQVDIGYKDVAAKIEKAYDGQK